MHAWWYRPSAGVMYNEPVVLTNEVVHVQPDESRYEFLKLITMHIICGLQLFRQEKIKMKKFSAESTCQSGEIKMDAHSAHQPQFNENPHHELVTNF